MITNTAATEFNTAEFDTSKKMNQVISIHEYNIYQASIYTNITEKQKYAHSLGVAKINEFVGLIIKFIDSHSGIAT
ncbi:39926_t:CDS:2, partial [Gigaspora margarita]